MFFPLKTFLKWKNCAKHTLFLGFYVEAVSKIDIIVIIVIKKEDIIKGGQLYSCFYYNWHLQPTIEVAISIVL